MKMAGKTLSWIGPCINLIIYYPDPLNKDFLSPAQCRQVCGKGCHARRLEVVLCSTHQSNRNGIKKKVEDAAAENVIGIAG